jgi:hypothetical protein
MAGRIQLLLKGLDDTYLTGSPQISYFRTVFNSFDQFQLKYKENQFYSSGVAYGGSQLCIIKNFGDIVRSNFLKIRLPSLFVSVYSDKVWCFPEPSALFRPDIYLYDKNLELVKTLRVNDTAIFYNTSQLTWLPREVSIQGQKFKFNFGVEYEYIGFDSKTEALFWGFKNYESELSYIKFQNSRYIFTKRNESEINFKQAGWLNSFSKYLRSYKPDVGSLFIENIELYIGAQLIETIPGKYLSIYKDIHVPEQLQASLNQLEGADAKPSTSESVYYVYIPTSLKNIPICALTHQDVEFKVYFKTFQDIIDQQYLNIDSQFLKTETLSEESNISVFDGTSVYHITNTGISGQTNFGKTVFPKSVIRSGPYLYLSSTDSNLCRCNTITNTTIPFPFTTSYKIKPSASILYTTNLLNITPNGIVQRLGSEIDEYVLDVSGISKVVYFNTLLFFITPSKVFIYRNDLEYSSDFNVTEIPYTSAQNTTTLYLLGKSVMYIYDIDTGISKTSLPEQDPTHALIVNTILYIYFASGRVYTYPDFTRKPNMDLRVRDVYGQRISSISTHVYALSEDGTIKILRDLENGTYETPTTSNKYTRIFDGFFFSNSRFGYIQSGSLIENSLGVTLIGDFDKTFNNTDTIYILDSELNLYTFKTNESDFPTALVSYEALSGYTVKSLAYDGTYIYMFPSNGKSRLFKYDTRKDFNEITSYTSETLIDSITNQPKNIYVDTTAFDGFNVYGIPNSSDGNLISYNIYNQYYNFTDFVKYGQDYSVQDISKSIIVDNDLYMFHSNGFYRFDTALIGTSITSNLIPFSNTLVNSYDRLNSNIYIFSNNLAVDGFVFVKTTSLEPTQTQVKPISYNNFRNNVYSSYVTIGSDFVFVPSVGNTMAVIQKTNPSSVQALNTNQPPNGSLTSLLHNNKLYIFPGPKSSNTIIYDIINDTSNVVDTPLSTYTTAVGYEDFIYLTSSNVITRLDTRLDSFFDYSGYTELSANGSIKLSDLITQDESNVYFVGSKIRKYQPTTNTYTEYPETLMGNVVGISNYTNSNIYILRDTGTLYISNIKYTNIGYRNDVYQTPLDVTGNAQYVYTLFSNTLGRLDLGPNADFDGTGYIYTSSTPRPVVAIPLTTLSVNSNIFTVYNTNAVTRFENGVYTNLANIESRNVFSKSVLIGSNIYMLSNSNQVVEYNTNNVLKTSNLRLFTIPISNISSVSNTSAHLYFTSKTSNTIVQYKPSIIYSANVDGGFSESYNYNSTIFYFPYQSNTVLAYSVNTQNFINLPDVVINGTITEGNVVAAHNQYIMTDTGGVYTITNENTTGLFKGYSWNMINSKSKGYRAEFDRGLGTQIIPSPVIRNVDSINTITVDLYLYAPGTWDYVDGSISGPGGSTIRSFTIARPELKRGYTLGKPFEFKHNGKTVKVDDIMFLPGSTFSNVIPDITAENYIASSDGACIYNLETNKLYGPNSIQTALYPFSGTIRINYDSTFSNTYTVQFQTVDQLIRTLSPQTITTQTGGINLTIRKVNEQTVNVITTITGFVPGANLVLDSTTTIAVPGFVNYSFKPNSPTQGVFNFSNVYSSPRFTYIFNNGTNDMIVYKNGTNYSSPLRSFPLRGVGNINKMIHQGSGSTTLVYTIADNFSNVYRFNEESDSSSYTNFNIVLSNTGTFTNSDMFSLIDGVGVVTNSEIYGLGIQNRAVYNYSALSSTHLKNPIRFDSNIKLFSVNGNTVVNASLQRVSDVSDTSLYSRMLTITGNTDFRYAFYDDTKYVYIVQKSNILLMNTTSIVNRYPVAWNVGPGGTPSPEFSYITSSNTNNILLSYVDSDQRTYQRYTYPIPSIYANTVQFYSNTAYMIPSTGSNVIVFNMESRQFTTIPLNDSSPGVFYRPGTYVSTTSVNGIPHGISNIHTVVDDERYLWINGRSNTIQYDYVSNTIVPVKQISSNTSIKVGSNVYLFSPTNVTRVSIFPRSYIQRPVEANSNGLQFYNDAVYFTSASNVYSIPYDLQLEPFKILNAYGTPGKSVLYNSNIAFSYPGKILVFDAENRIESNITTPIFTHFTVDSSNVFFSSNGMNMARNSSPNENIRYDPTFRKLGPIFYNNRNVYSLTDTSTFIIYNLDSPPFASTELPYDQNVATVYTRGQYAYYPPGLNGNIIQRYDMTKLFFDRESYDITYSSNSNYTSYLEIEDMVYFVPKQNANLINFNDASEIRGYTIPANTIASVYDGRFAYFSNSTHINKFYFEPIPSTEAFRNNISFTQQTFINDLIFDGKSIYALGDFIYIINTSTLQESDQTGIFQDTSQNILDRNKYNTGYFDGRFLNLVTDSVKIYDLLPLEYPDVFSPSMLTEYAYITDRNRRVLQSRELKHLIKQLQTVKIPSNKYVRVEFWNPMSELVFDGDVDTAALFLNGNEKFECDANFMKTVQILNHHSRRPTRSNICTYSFASNPEDEYPDSHVNMSRIRDKVLYVTNSSESEVTVYGITHNIVKFRDGLGGLVFNNSSQ